MAEDRLANARAQGQAQYDSIKEMVRACENAGGDEGAREDAERAIHEDALSVEVRSGWRSPSAMNDSPNEYRICLCTGGPAVQMIGELDEHGEPETARLQVQDWFTPWTDVAPEDPDDNAEPEEIMLVYARCHYFGES